MLHIEDIHASYGQVRVLSGISLRVGEKQIVTLLGSNGAGKSSLLKVISGLLKPDSGRMEFRGERIDGLSPEKIIARGIAHCPEGRRVFADLSVLENLELGAYLEKSKRTVKERIAEIGEAFPTLIARKGQMAGTLSGGEQQQLAIARALMSDPQMILFDEPSLGLAPILVDQVEDIITELKRVGMTLLLVEQNANLALRIADYAYVVETGQIVIKGPSGAMAKDDRVMKAYLGGS